MLIRQTVAISQLSSLSSKLNSCFGLLESTSRNFPFEQLVNLRILSALELRK